MKSSEQLLTAHQLAAQLGLTMDTVQRYVRLGKIPFVDRDNQRYFQLTAVIRALPGLHPKKVTYREYLALPAEPGFRVEVIDGAIWKDPRPGARHKRVQRRIHTRLSEYIMSVDPEGIIFFAPVDVTLSEIDAFRPDWLYVPSNRRHIVLEQRVKGPPKLVVEILSPGSTEKDRRLKMAAYARGGIPHYWLVNPGKRTLEAYYRRKGKYSLVVMGRGEVVITHPAFPELEVALGEVWD